MRSFFKQRFGFCLSILLILAVGLAPAITFARPSFAQSTCPVIVQQALDATSKQCTTAGRNKLCYGNNSIHADFQAGAGNVTFQAPGDMVDISQVKRITLGAMDTSANTWGVAEMKIKADLPNTDPNQNVTMIMFGDVQMSDAVSDANGTAVALVTPVSPESLTQTAVAEARQASQAGATSTKLAGLVGTATAKASTPAPTGTIPAAKRTQSAATATRLANLITTATAAPRPDSTTSTPTGQSYGPMQAFYFKSGDATACDQAPHDGLLIQTPHGSGRVSFVVDGVDIDLGSTVFIQTVSGGSVLVIYVLEGLASVTTPGNFPEFAGPGTFIEVLLDPTTLSVLLFSITPAQFYRSDAVRALPIQLLPGTIAPAPGLPDNLPFSTWNAQSGAVPPANGACITPNMTGQVLLAQNSTGDHVWLRRLPDPLRPFSVQFSQAADGSYSGTMAFASYPPHAVNIDQSSTKRETLLMRRTSPTHIDGQETIDNREVGGPNCLATIPFTLDQTNVPSSPLGPTETATN